MPGLPCPPTLTGVAMHHPRAVTPPGWYPDSYGVTRWWDGRQWTPATRQTTMQPYTPPPQSPFRVIAGVGLALAALGAVIAGFTQVSVASGLGMVWLGIAIGVIGAILAFAFNGATAVKVFAAIFALVAIVSAVYDQHLIDTKRQQIQQILNNP